MGKKFENINCQQTSKKEEKKRGKKKKTDNDLHNVIQSTKKISNANTTRRELRLLESAKQFLLHLMSILLRIRW
jgi:hypothetical protein